MSFTGNPRHPNNPPSDYPAEPTGAIAKDSLAGESIASGGAFAENDNAQPMGVKGYQSTLANDDSSNAEVLHAAESGAAREAQDARGLGSDERGEVGVKYPDAGAGQDYGGTTSDQGYRGGSGDPSVSSGGSGAFGDTYSGGGGADDNVSSSGYSQQTSGSTGSTSNTSSTGIRPHVDQAPNYAGDFTTEGEMKPKGDDLVEGGDILPNRSTYTGAVGDDTKDPGRLAERDFQKTSADFSGGTGTREYGNVAEGGDDTIYSNLNSSERA